MKPPRPRADRTRPSGVPSPQRLENRFRAVVHGDGVRRFAGSRVKTPGRIERVRRRPVAIDDVDSVTPVGTSRDRESADGRAECRQVDRHRLERDRRSPKTTASLPASSPQRLRPRTVHDVTGRDQRNLCASDSSRGLRESAPPKISPDSGHRKDAGTAVRSLRDAAHRPRRMTACPTPSSAAAELCRSLATYTARFSMLYLVGFSALAPRVFCSSASSVRGRSGSRHAQQRSRGE